MILLSHPTGNANVRQAALAFQESGLLLEFWTTIAYRPGSWHDYAPKTLHSQLKRRSYDPALAPHLRTRPLREWMRHIAGSLGLGALTDKQAGRFSVDAVYRDLDSRVAQAIRQSGDALLATYAYEDGALASFKAAKERGKICLYDLPIGYWRAARSIMAEEAERQPDWAMTIPGNKDSHAKLARKDEELQLADHVFVASSFTRQTLQCAEPLRTNVSIIPYGFPTNDFDIGKRRYSPPGSPLKVLFVGSLGQRKGLSYLFESIAQLGSAVDLTIVGKRPSEACSALERALQTVRYHESLPHEQILAFMQSHDVFVFPSLFEGYGLVLIEAMSQGMPIIATPHTAAPDILGDSGGGFIVPIRDASAISEKLLALHDDRDLLANCGHRAWKQARRFPWETYRQQLAQQCKEVIAKPAPR